MISQEPTVLAPVNMKPEIGISLHARNDEDFGHSRSHVYMLSEAERNEVKTAMVYFKALGLDGDKISPASFPLPTLGGVLRTMTAELHNERGFFVLRGLDPHEVSSEDVILRYLGISSYIADKIAVQDEYGNVFAHIREAKYATAFQEDRPVRDSTLASSFHSDETCDIMAMHTTGLAAEGGDHIVASSAAVYDTLYQTNPDVIPILMEPNWYFDTRGRLAQEKGRAILYKHDGHIIFNFNRQALQGVTGIVPYNLKSSLTGPQLEALDAIEASARRVQFPLKAELGDITFVNNFTTLHAREGFRDSPSATRHLVRMWLKNSTLAYELPPQLAELNDRLFDESIKRNWNVLPKARLSFTLIEKLGP